MSCPEFTYYQFNQFLKTVTIPCIWLGVLSLTWELVTSMFRLDSSVCVFIVHWSQNAHGYSVFSQVCLRLRVLQQVLWDRPVDRVCCCHSCHVHCQSGGSQSSTNTDVRESSRGSKSLSFHLQVPFTYVDYDSNARLWPAVRQAHEMVDRYQLVNSYGLFRRMTGVGGRPEVVIEGSRDGVTWTVSVATDFTLFFFLEFLASLASFFLAGDWVYVQARQPQRTPSCGHSSPAQAGLANVVCCPRESYTSAVVHQSHVQTAAGKTRW